MSNPYAAPSHSADVEVGGGVRPASKPLRIWIFQFLLALHLAGAVAITASLLQSSEVRALPPRALLLGFIRPMLVIAVVATLIVALQRLGPKPRVVAPVLASLWWLLSLASHFALEVPPEPSPRFDDGLSAPLWVAGIVLHAGLFWFVVSTWRHHATRAYLSRDTAESGRLHSPGGHDAER
jgi:hypothetical protein